MIFIDECFDLVAIFNFGNINISNANQFAFDIVQLIVVAREFAVKE